MWLCWMGAWAKIQSLTTAVYVRTSCMTLRWSTTEGGGDAATGGRGRCVEEKRLPVFASTM